MDSQTLYPEFVPIAIVSALLPVICIPWQWQARNVATLSIIAWCMITNLIYAVDAILWSNNVEIKAEVWCDILEDILATKILIGANFALPSASFCVAVYIEHITAVRDHQFIIANKRHRDIFELVMTFGLPAVFMALHYVVQGHRFDIFKGYGCRPATYFSIPALLIVWIPPLLLSVGALICAASTVRYIIIRRYRQFHALPLNWSNSYTIRFTLIIFVEMIWAVTITAWVLGYNLSNGIIQPWINWDNVHFNFSRVYPYDLTLGDQVTQRVYYLNWWVVPISTWIFTIFCGFGNNALVKYKRFFFSIRDRCASRKATGVDNVTEV